MSHPLRGFNARVGHRGQRKAPTEGDSGWGQDFGVSAGAGRWAHNGGTSCQFRDWDHEIKIRRRLWRLVVELKPDAHSVAPDDAARLYPMVG